MTPSQRLCWRPSRITRLCPKILSPRNSDYRVLEGGQGAGTVAMWKLQATKSRVRDVKVNLDVAGHTVIEKGTPTRRW